MNTLWNLLTEPSPIKQVRWFAKSERNNLGGIARSPQALEHVARLSKSGYNCYVTLNPTTDRSCKRIKQEDVTHWAFLLLDLDPLEPYLDFDAAIKWLSEISDPSPAILRSGRGLQGWLRFAPQECGSLEAKRLYVDVNRGFLKKARGWLPEGWRLDMTSDLSRIARMPGSFHQTSGEMAQFVSLNRMASQEETGHFVERHYEPSPHQSADLSILSGPVTWEEVIDDLTMTAKNYILVGASEGERHRTCQHTCKTLYEHGVSKESALQALTLGNEACMEPLSDREVRSILDQVYGKG